MPTYTRRKVIQIISPGRGATTPEVAIALCNDGTLWRVYRNGYGYSMEWEQIDTPPDWNEPTCG